MNVRTHSSTAKGRVVSTPAVGNFLQRQCACGQHTIGGAECEECRVKRVETSFAGSEFLERRAASQGSTSEVYNLLRSPLQPRFRRDFNNMPGLVLPEVPAPSVRARDADLGGRVEAVGSATCDPDQGKITWKIDYQKTPLCMADCVYEHEKAHADFGQAECSKVSAAAKAATDALNRAKQSRSDADLKKAERAAKDFEKAKAAYDSWLDGTCKADEQKAYQAGIDKCKTPEVQKQCADFRETNRYTEIMKQWEGFKQNPPNCPEPAKKAEEEKPGKPKEKTESSEGKQALTPVKACLLERECTPQRLSTNRAEASTVPPIVYDVLRSPAQPLDAAARSLFEPRFGRDFSQVRVHTDAKAAESAEAVSATAYTVGRDMVFGIGQYEWRTERGRRLVAHELAHVVQQSAAAPAPEALSICSPLDDAEKAAETTSESVVASLQAQPMAGGDESPFGRKPPALRSVGFGTVSRQVVQRAKIPYKTLSWADFNGTPPSGATLEAWTKSGFDVPAWKPKVTAEDAKEACTADKKPTTKFKATVSVHPAVFDSVTAYMNQEQSWVKPRYKDGGRAYCAGKAAECSTHFSDAAAEAKTECKAEVEPCKEAFARGSREYTLPVGSTTVIVTSAAECSTMLPKSCQAALVASASWDLKPEGGTTIATASRKDDCTKGIQAACLTFEKAEGPKLLKHEQGHFDINKVVADNARASLQAKAGTFVATETKCGKTEAVKAAREAFDKLGAGDALQKLGQSWMDAKNKAEADYDLPTQTDHGKNAKGQSNWEAKIAAGLKEYDPTKPPPSAPGTVPTPATTPAVPPAPAP